MESQVRVLPSRYAAVTERGISAGIRIQILQVQILSKVPKYLGVAREFRELQVAGSIPATQTLPL
ncbi:hypothetical protein [Nostoc sp.]|uniref:hypothetical protein n=1 Tax=Nostoc sp. TaxID=1180 RepID=UPI002FFC836E